jgi:predicted TPR repeat methyltransferase
MKIDKIKHIYSDFVETYDKDLKKDMKYTAYLRVARNVINVLKTRHARVLDLGCGTGLSSLLFLKKGHEVTGIDATRAMIERARRLPYKKLICQNLEAPLRVKDNSFDAVVMIGVMEYINDPKSLFEEVRSKLDEGGVFGLTVPKKTKWYSDAGLRSYYKKEMEPIFLKSGFKIITCEEFLGTEEDGVQVYYWNYLLRKA